MLRMRKTALFMSPHQVNAKSVALHWRINPASTRVCTPYGDTSTKYQYTV
jgi:hypothetical protein